MLLAGQRDIPLGYWDRLLRAQRQLDGSAMVYQRRRPVDERSDMYAKSLMLHTGNIT